MAILQPPHWHVDWVGIQAACPWLAPLIELLLGYGARVRIVCLDAPLGEVLRRNGQRSAPVPEAVIRRLAAATEPPDLSEAHVVEWVEVVRSA